jgi:hypothetical protein
VTDGKTVTITAHALRHLRVDIAPTGLSYCLKSTAHQFTNCCRTAWHSVFKSELVDGFQFVSGKRDLQ